MSSQNNNDIIEGFQTTEIGLLPEEWATTKLGDLFEIKQGKALSPEHRRGISPRPFLRTANVFWGYLDLTSVDSMDFTDAEVSQLKLMPNDLLVCEGGDIGRTAIWRDESKVCCYQNHLHRLRTSRGDVHPLFYMYWMQAAHLLLRLYGGTGNKTTIPNLSQSRLKSFILPLPPLPEQKTIARVLSTIQKAIETQDKIIAAARELKKSLMRHLFTFGPVPVAEAEKVPLKETEIGPVPEHWEVVAIGDAVSTTQYGLSLRGEQSGKYPILRMNNLIDGRVNDLDLQYVNLENGDFEKFRVKKGDILFNRTNSYELVGKTGLFDLEGDFVFASYLVRVVTHPSRLCPRYLNNYLNYSRVQDRLKMLATRGVSQSNINATKLRGFKIPLAPIPEQEEIATILSSADKKIEAGENRRISLQALFKTMLHHLMTGKVRVNHLEAEVS